MEPAMSDSKQQTLVTRTEVRRIARAEVERYADTVLAGAMARIVGELRREIAAATAKDGGDAKDAEPPAKRAARTTRSRRRCRR
jgi:hypothetical protein